MAARLVAFAGRMLRRGGSPGAVSSFIYARLSPLLPHNAPLSQCLTVVRASTRGSQLLRVRAPKYTNSRLKYRRGMSAGGGSAPWPVHRGVLSRFPPQSHNPLVRDLPYKNPDLALNAFIQNHKDSRCEVRRYWPISNRNYTIIRAMTMDYFLI